MAADIVLFFSLAVGLTKVIDLFLSQGNKQTLDMAALRLWNRFDIWKSRAKSVWVPLARTIDTSVIALSLLFGIVFSAVVILAVYANLSPLYQYLFKQVFLPAVLMRFATVFTPIAIVLLLSKTYRSYLIGTLLGSLALIGEGLLEYAWMYWRMEPGVPREVALTVVFAVTVGLLMIFAYTLSSTAFRLGLIYVFQCVLWSLEFIARRICESSGGVVFGLSIVLGLLATLAKYYSDG